MRARGLSADKVLAGTDLSKAQLQDSALLVDPRQAERVILSMLW